MASSPTPRHRNDLTSPPGEKRTLKNRILDFVPFPFGNLFEVDNEHDELVTQEDFRRMLNYAAIWPVAVFFAVTALLLGLVSFMLKSADLVDRTDRVIAQMHTVQTQILDMETGLRGFQVTGRSEFLDPYNEARQHLGEDLNGLRTLIPEDSKQAMTMRGLRGTLQDWETFADEILLRKRNGGNVGDPKLNQRGKDLIDSASGEIDTFIAVQEKLRTNRLLTLDHLRLSLVWAILLLVGLLGPIAVLWLRRLVYRVNQNYRASILTVARQTEELRVTLRSIGDAVVSTNAKGNVVFLNPVAERLTGWTNDEANGRALSEIFSIIDEETRSPAENPVERALRDLSVVYFNKPTVLVARDGRVIPIEDSAAPILGDFGEVHGAIVIFHDVTQTREAERKVRESEARLRLAMEAAGLGTWEWQPSTGVIRWSKEIYPLYGVEVGTTITPELFSSRIHPEDKKRVLDAVGYAVHQPGISDVSYRIMLPSGDVRWVASLGRVVGEGADARLIGVVQDITERKEAAERLTFSEARLRQLADAMPQIVWMARSNGVLDYYNRRWYQLTGVDEVVDGSQTDVQHPSWAAIVHPDDREPSIEAWNGAIRSGDKFEFRNRWFDKITGSYRWFLHRAVPITAPDGKITRWFGSSTDIDEIVRAEKEARAVTEELEKASHAKDRFLASLSHELRTPLTPVLICLTLLLDDPTLTEDAREQLTMIQRNIELEARLIDDLLDITRISTGKLRLHIDRCDIHALIRNSLEIIRHEANLKGITLQTFLDAASPWVEGDPARLQQVFWNLFRNAVKFTSGPGSITVRTKEVSGKLVISVTDTGRGIEREFLEKIFQPFEQGKVEGDHRFGGLGLGLAISQAITDIHHGNIHVTSEGVGHGSTFTVELPIQIDPPEKPQHSHEISIPLNETAPARPLRLLVVDDHQSTREILQRSLMRHGHEVIIAENISTALVIAKNHSFDLVVSDLGLPDGNGRDLIKILRADYGLQGIALSGYGTEDDIEKSLQAGFLAHLTKPIDLTELTKLLDQFANSARSMSRIVD